MPSPSPETALSVVIPAFNEADRLATSVARVRAYLAARVDPFEVVLVDDGSVDGTIHVMRELAAASPEVRIIDLPRNQGKGRAVREGVLASTGRRVLISDADLSTPIEELSKLERAVDGGADIAIGSRFAAGAQIEVAQPPHRVVMGQAFRLMVQALLLRGVGDTQCGFKLLRGDLARRVFAELRTDRFAYDVELLCRMRSDGAAIAEVPIVWLHSGRSSVVPVRDSAEMLRDLMLLRLRLSARGRTGRLR